MVFAAMLLGCSVFIPYFFTLTNLIAVLLSVSMVGMLACSMMFCLAAGDFDLSIEAVVACAGVLTAVVIGRTGSVLLGVAAGVGVGAVVGLVNGLVIAKLRINALITTLATMQIVRGLAFIVSKGSAVGISEASFFALGNASVLGLSVPIWITLACFAAAAVLLNRTVFGKNALAIGGNEVAARLSGINVAGMKVSIFALQGVLAGLAGVILASRMTSGQPNASQGLALDVISACVLGGVSLSGGIATITGTVVGVFIMGVVQNAMNLLNIPTFYQYVARGLILLAAVLFDRLKRDREA